MKNVTPALNESPSSVGSKDGIDTHRIFAEQSLDSTEQLLPFGEAAKAIFIKANGVTAYNRGIRFVRRAD